MGVDACDESIHSRGTRRTTKGALGKGKKTQIVIRPSARRLYSPPTVRLPPHPMHVFVCLPPAGCLRVPSTFMTRWRAERLIFCDLLFAASVWRASRSELAAWDELRARRPTELQATRFADVKTQGKRSGNSRQGRRRRQRWRRRERSEGV